MVVDVEENRGSLVIGDVGQFFGRWLALFT
jgi:hypothetical protein